MLKKPRAWPVRAGSAAASEQPGARGAIRTTRSASSPRRATTAWVLLCALLAGCCFWLGTGGDPQPGVVNLVAVSGVSSPEPQTRPIEAIRLGDRLVGRNPIREQAELAEPDPATWRKISLSMTNQRGLRLWVELLRPQVWIDVHSAKPGSTVILDLYEMGAVGDARVDTVEPCPPIAFGPGNVVTGRFRHEADPDTVVLQVEFSNGKSLSGVTHNHLFWSEDRQLFVPVGKFKKGERVRTIEGTATVTSVSSRLAYAGEMLYNLETRNEHVYQVTAAGILVYNSCVVNDVLNESANVRGNFTSRFVLTQDEALTAGQRWLGRGYREIGRPGSGVFPSADGLRQFRMDNNSLLGRHAPNRPHVHFEWFENPTDPFPMGNNHVPFH